MKWYQLYCAYGLIKNKFRGNELIPLENVYYKDLDGLNTENKPEISVITASRILNGWKAPKPRLTFAIARVTV